MWKGIIWQEHEETVAIKELSRASYTIQLTDKQVKASFEWEAFQLSSVHHPYIVQFRGVADTKDNERSFLVTEFCAGGNLEQWLRKEQQSNGKFEFHHVFQDKCLSLIYSDTLLQLRLLGLVLGFG